jgi:3-oxoacyl-[acyl-carrier protein] reductase
MVLDGKSVVVTGSTRGLGRAIALDLAASGAAVVVNGTSADRVDEVERQIVSAGGRAVGVSGSVAELEVCEALVAGCIEHFGRIDLLVHNAGVVRDRTLLKMTAEEFDTVVGVHLRGAWACAKFAAREMVPAGGGHILNVTSGASLFGAFGQSNYAAAKGGINGLTRALTVELAGTGVQAALEPFPPAEDVAPLVTFLASDAAAHINGQIFEFDGHELALWTHPEQVGRVARGDRWEPTDFAAYFNGAPLQALHPGRWGGGVRTSLATAAGDQGAAQG